MKAQQPPVETYWDAFEQVLGPRPSWPPGLHTLVQVMLESQAPQQLLWGPSLHVLHNPAFAPILGERRHGALGRPLLEVWPELSEELTALSRPVFAGTPVAFEDRPFVVRRNGVDETAWFTFACTPVRDESARVTAIHVAITETTGRVLSNRAQAELSARLQLLFEQAPGFIAFLTGPQHVFTLANRAYMALVGRSDLIGRAVAEALPEVVDQGFVELLDRVFRTGEPFVGRRVPVDLRAQNPRTSYVDFVYQPVADSAGNVTGIFVQGSDVTEQVLAEEVLRERSEEAVSAAATADAERRRLDSLLRSAPVGILYVDADGRIVLTNDAIRRLWGSLATAQTYQQHADWPRRWADHSARHGERVAPHDLPIARALRGEDTDGALIEIEAPDGSRRVTLVHAASVRDAKNAVVGAVVTTQDMSDRVRIEAQLRESEGKFRTIADAMPQMVWSTLPDGYHDYFNRQWYAFTSMPLGSTDGDAWNGIFHPDDQDRAWDRWRESLATGRDYEIEYRLRHHSGEYRWVLGRALALRDEHGAIVRWMGTCTDVHDMRTLQAELQHSRNALALANERKDAFLATLAHELRNPLAPIGTAAHILQLAAGDPARVRQASQIIARQVQHMTALVNDLTDVARVTQGLVEYHIAPLDLREVLNRAVEQVRPKIELQNHALVECGLDAPLPVRGDRTRLVQVFSNLLGNAAKYTPPGGTLTLEARMRGGEVTVSLRDTGIGIGPALLPHVFELFTQAERDERRTHQGLGIGLAVVERIVGAHGGRIVAESPGLGLGSTFSVHLPCAGQA